MHADIRADLHIHSEDPGHLHWIDLILSTHTSTDQLSSSWLI